jgi:A/G-specific adenine glycosylase
MKTIENAAMLQRMRRRLLAWYDSNRRDLPWRAAPGCAIDPYHVWLSEIMLQQTTAAAVVPYFTRFVRRWPRVEDLAAAELDDVLRAWAGLGYYARARNLHTCARVVSDVHGGEFPQAEEALKRLPGIGDYTAAAIAAIAFARPAAPVDGNIVRVIARLFAVEAEMPRARPAIESLARMLTPVGRPGDFAQALMDLGATICKPRRPRCGACPLQPDCDADGLGHPERFPVKAVKKPRPQLHGTVFWIADGSGAILLRRRPKDGLLGGMMEVPSTAWRAQRWPLTEALSAAPVQAEWRPLPGGVSHSFTHFNLELTVVAGTTFDTTAAGGIWCQPDQLDRHALPTLMRKVAAHACSSLAAGSGENLTKAGKTFRVSDPIDRRLPGSRKARPAGTGR